MEYIKNEDLEAIGSIIEEFEGDTMLGKHMFKAVKAYFKQKNKQSKVIYTSEIKTPKTKDDINISHSSNLERVLQDADKALHKYYLNLSKKGKSNGTTKSKKKTN
jgi:predicted component of viral defense system (DUF524 family)